MGGANQDMLMFIASTISVEPSTERLNLELDERNWMLVGGRTGVRLRLSGPLQGPTMFPALTRTYTEHEQMADPIEDGRLTSVS